MALTQSRSLSLTIERDDWRDQSACRDTDPDLFFPVGTTGPALRVTADAKRTCARCPVNLPLPGLGRYVRPLDTGQTSGVWGGSCEKERTGAAPYRPP